MQGIDPLHSSDVAWAGWRAWLDCAGGDKPGPSRPAGSLSDTLAKRAQGACASQGDRTESAGNLPKITMIL